MRLKLGCVVFLVLSGIFGMAARSAPAQEVPAEVIIQRSDAIGAPSNLQEQVARVDVIAVVRIEKSEPVAIAPVSSQTDVIMSNRFLDLPEVFTRYTTETLSAIKGTPSGWPLLQKAGELRWAQYLIKANPGESPLTPGEYVVFLRWSDPLAAFVFDASEAYDVSGAFVQTRGARAVARLQVGRNSRDFIEQIQKMVNR